MPLDDREAPRTDADRQWSEYNHHVAGLIVFIMGILAILYRTGWAPWARHWPLVFFALAAFLLVRNDPGSWPLGPQGFWEGMQFSEVVQHRIFVLLVLGFGTFEWMVRTARIRSPRAALVSLSARWAAPSIDALSRLLNLKEEYLIEVTPRAARVIASLWAGAAGSSSPPPGRHVRAELVGRLAMVGVLLLPIAKAGGRRKGPSRR